VGVSRDCPNFFWYPLLSQEWVKLRTSNFVGTFIGLIGTKAHENVVNSAVGVVRAPICRAHCAVIFAIAQLSCFTCDSIHVHEYAIVRVYGTAIPSICPSVCSSVCYTRGFYQNG